MCGKTPKDKSADIAAQQERERQARITAGTAEIDKNFASFDDNFYNGISDAYASHYRPLLDEQYMDAQKSLYLNPVGGTTNSSAFAEQLANFEKDYQRQIADIGNRGLSEATNYRANVAQNRGNLIGQLNGGASVEQAATMAAQQAKSLQAAPVYSALGDVFSKFTAAGVNAANAGAFNQDKLKSNPLLFGTSSGNAEKRVN